MTSYRYLWTVLAGWVIVILSTFLNHQAAFWIGGVIGIGCGIAAIALSVFEMSRGVKHIIVHGISWTLAVSLIFMCAMWMYAVTSGV